MAQVLYETDGAYDNWRRSTDFYDEGELVLKDGKGDGPALDAIVENSGFYRVLND